MAAAAAATEADDGLAGVWHGVGSAVAAEVAEVLLARVGNSRVGVGGERDWPRAADE